VGTLVVLQIGSPRRKFQNNLNVPTIERHRRQNDKVRNDWYEAGGPEKWGGIRDD
jgi:hypothetical protein